MSITLGGTVCVRNGIELDYCFEQAIESLLPICEQVVVCDGESTDGTWEEVQRWAAIEPKLALCRYAWPDPKGDLDFLVKWINYAREHLRTHFHFALDADEVVGEGSYKRIHHFKQTTHPNRKVSLWCHRYNYWQDAWHLIPHGHCCSDRVVRVAPARVWMPSDGCAGVSAELGQAAVDMAVESDIEIFHYGFLRRPAAYFEKSRQLHTMFFGGYTDARLHAVEGRQDWMKEIKDVEWTSQLIPFRGQHPARMHAWLKERGWKYV